MGNDAFDDLCETIEEQTKLLLERDLKIVDLKKQLAIAAESLGIIKHYKSRSGDDVQAEIAQKALKQIEELSK